MKLRDRLADLDFDDEQITTIVQEFRGYLEDLAVEQDRKNRKGSTIRNIVTRIRNEEVVP